MAHKNVLNGSWAANSKIAKIWHVPLIPLLMMCHISDIMCHISDIMWGRGRTLLSFEYRPQIDQIYRPLLLFF